MSAGGTSTSSSRQTSGPQRPSQQQSTYQIPASVLYESADDPRASGSSVQTLSVGRSGNCYYINVSVVLVVLTICISLISIIFQVNKDQSVVDRNVKFIHLHCTYT